MKAMSTSDDELFQSLLNEELAKPLKFFPHDTDAFDDDALYELWTKGGWAFYGMFWRLCELLAKRDYHSYPADIDRLSYELRVEVDVCREFVTTLLELGLLNKDSYGLGKLRSDRMDRNGIYAATQTARRRLGAAKTNAKKR